MVEYHRMSQMPIIFWMTNPDRQKKANWCFPACVPTQNFWDDNVSKYFRRVLYIWYSNVLVWQWQAMADEDFESKKVWLVSHTHQNHKNSSRGTIVCVKTSWFVRTTWLKPGSWRANEDFEGKKVWLAGSRLWAPLKWWSANTGRHRTTANTENTSTRN